MVRYSSLDCQHHMQNISFDILSGFLSFGHPKSVSALNLLSSGFDCGDIDLKITAGEQSCFVSFANSVNELRYFWLFLERLITCDGDTCLLYIDQEGPEAVIVARPHGEELSLAIIENGWYEFDPDNPEKAYKKVFNNDYSVRLNIICPKRAFISQIFNILKKFKNATSEDDYYYESAMYENEIVKKYCEE